MKKFYNMEEFSNKIKEQRPDILDDMAKNELADRLTRQLINARSAKNFSQIKLAQRANLKQFQISRLEKGQLGNTRNLLNVVAALDMDIKLIPKNARIAIFNEKVISKRPASGRKIRSVKASATVKHE